MSFGANLQSTIASALGGFGIPSLGSANLQPNPQRNTTATSLTIVVNGQVQGLIRSLRVERPYDQHRIKVIGSVVNAGFVPGVFEPSASISKIFLYGQDIAIAFGGTIRPVNGTQSVTNDFTQFYFNIVEVDALGNTIKEYHDCVLASESKSVDIDSVIIMEEASIYIRYVEDFAS